MPELLLGLANGCPLSFVLLTAILTTPHGHLPFGKGVSWWAYRCE